ncbi:MAG: pyridoxamine 5'-phosphate oxidase [Acidobacteria bacterium]|nr:pyridoxamine 5'-phosphate oxidase [Acidobacteriota bacterium]
MSVARDPMAEFGALFERARNSPEPGDATACALATASADGTPSVRMVLLKGFDDRGFVFYTNYGSRKAQDIEENPRAALCFHWISIKQQVRVEGSVERVSEEESDIYFASRGRLSRLGAWASKQSQPLASRGDLLRRFAAVELRYPVGPVPRPQFWGGYRLRPERIEFWSNKSHRLHDRRVFSRSGEGWTVRRLYP